MKRRTLAALTVLAATLMACSGGSSDYGAKAPQPSGYHHQPGGFEPSAVEHHGGDGMADAEMAPAPAGAPRTQSSEDVFSPSQPKSRPGLATSWGESRHSKVTSAPFVRANHQGPFAVGKVFYNDPAGIAAMTDSYPGARPQTRRFAVGNGHIEMGIRDGGGHFLTGFEMGNNNYVTGVAGRRYSIVIKNHSPGRVEIVASVDGLDVIDGKPASFNKRGYLVDPFGDLEIEGFRTSTDQVAAFRFGSVESSYANKKHGETRNVGVIGVAVFHEQGDNPNLWGTPQDGDKRHNADPFPQKFASPPGY